MILTWSSRPVCAGGRIAQNILVRERPPLSLRTFSSTAAESVTSILEEPTPTLQGFTDAGISVSIARHVT